MATVGMECITFKDLAKVMTNENKDISPVVEVLTQLSPMVANGLVREANGITTHRTTIRTGLPQSYWRLINRGVPKSKSTIAQIDDTIGTLETWSTIDEDLLNLNGRRAAYLLSEEKPFLESMTQELEKTTIYGNEKNEPAAFSGLAARYNTLDVKKAQSAENVINMGGIGNSNTSIWLVVWGDSTVHYIYPKGFKAGLSRKTYENNTALDENNLEFRAYKTNYSLKLGLTVRDWRYVVRIANIDTSKLDELIDNGATTSASQKLVRAMIKAYNKIPNINMGRACWYMNRTTKLMLDIMAAEKSNVNLTIGNFEGEEVTRFKGIPVLQCDSILDTEEAITAS